MTENYWQLKLHSMFIFLTPQNLKNPCGSLTVNNAELVKMSRAGLIFPVMGQKSLALFDKSSSKPIWMYSGGNSYNVAISKDGKYMAAATAGDEADLNANLIILWNGKSEKPLWQYHAAGNFHDVSFSDDGKFIAGSTGCPDRRFYLFSKDSNNPLIKSEQLTRDSPVHRAKISADGMLAAVGSESDDGAG